jgi:hypothetical protein
MEGTTSPASPEPTPTVAWTLPTYDPLDPRLAAHAALIGAVSAVALGVLATLLVAILMPGLVVIAIGIPGAFVFGGLFGPDTVRRGGLADAIMRMAVGAAVAPAALIGGLFSVAMLNPLPLVIALLVSGMGLLITVPAAVAWGLVTRRLASART